MDHAPLRVLALRLASIGLIGFDPLERGLRVSGDYTVVFVTAAWMATLMRRSVAN